MSKNGEVFLKPAMFGGFKRKAVLSYIFELNETTQDAQQKLTAQVEELTKARDILSENVKEMGQRLAATQSELQAAQSQLSLHSEESGSQVKQLKDEIDRLSQIIAQKNGDITRHISVNENLEKENKELAKKMQAFSEKRSQLEQATAQLNDIMGRAKGDAVKIIEQAKASAAKITSGANIQADNIIENAKGTAKKQIADAHRKIDGIYRQFDGFHSELGDLRKTVAGAVSAINEKMDTLHQATSSLRSKTPEKAFSVEAPAETQVEAPVAPDKKDDDALTQAGIQKDDSGFFRLAAEE